MVGTDILLKVWIEVFASLEEAEPFFSGFDGSLPPVGAADGTNDLRTGCFCYSRGGSSSHSVSSLAWTEVPFCDRLTLMQLETL
jgi:hypothetical protein